jgi:hypothetical protein
MGMSKPTFCIRDSSRTSSKMPLTPPLFFIIRAVALNKVVLTHQVPKGARLRLEVWP